MMKFTKEELYFIEISMGEQTAILSNNFKKAGEQFLIFNSLKGVTDKRKQFLFDLMDENIRSFDVMKSIRDKCEKERLGGE